MIATGINPLLVVKDMSLSVEFYESYLGFKKKTELTNNDGSLRYVDFEIGKSILMLVPENTRRYKLERKGEGVELYVDVGEDIWRISKELKKKGLNFEKELFKTPWNTWQFHLKDPDGYLLIFSLDII